MRHQPHGGRALTTVIVAMLAIAAFLAYRGELPGFRASGTADTTDVATLTAPEPPLDQAAVAAAVDPVLVDIKASTGTFGLSSAGSGIVLTADGQVLTSHHVVKGADRVTVTDVGNGKLYTASVLGYDSTADIALLALAGASGLPAAKLGSSAQLRLRQQVLALGNAGGVGGTPTAVAGLITDLDSTIVALNAADLSRKALTGVLEVSAAVSPGQSGGAVVDRAGSVIGVIAAASGEHEGGADRAPSGYAVPIDAAMNIVEQIRSGTPTERVHVGPTATLGVLISDAESGGARIDLTIYGQPAQRAGLAEGEVITALDGRAIASARALREAINVRKPDDVVTLEITEAEGGVRTVPVVLVLGSPN
ncbi:S1C family serine protease [Nocardia callitridis]|uniref:Trypsin-like peptidase domain-containing protein n=1 Tax=Nocardia callitridis TaxID=648753 RepID=A0ABP9JX36_9NOCA